MKSLFICIITFSCYADNLFLPNRDPDLVDVPPFYDNIVRAQKEEQQEIQSTLEALNQQFKDPELASCIDMRFKGGLLQELLQLIGINAKINFTIDPRINNSIGPLIFHQQPIGIILRNVCETTTPALAIIKRLGSWHVLPRPDAMRLLSNNIEYADDTRLVQRICKLQKCICTASLKVKIEQMWDKIAGTSKNTYCFIDEDSRMVFLQGNPRQLTLMNTFINQLDQSIAQVRIDAVVAIVDRHFEHNLGFNWGGIYNRQSSVNCFGFVGVGGKLTDFPTPAKGVSPDTFAFHLFNKGAHPIRFPIVFGGPDLNTRRLNIEINAADIDSNTRILLRPSIVTSHNETAEILIGKSIPITTFVEDVIEGKVRNVQTINFKDVGTILHVKPFVLNDISCIVLDILVEDSSAHDIIDPKCPPIIKTIRTKNKVCLHDGQTIVIGGLTLNKGEYVNNSVPLLAKIPLIGWLFQANRTVDEDNELLIFITPTILRY